MEGGDESGEGGAGWGWRRRGSEAGEPGGEAESLWEGRGAAREARRGGWRLTAGGAGDDECVKVWRLV